MKEELEYRMYGLVPYNISPIQQAIQYGHALQEYNNTFFKEFFDDKWKGEKKSEDFYKFQKWANEDKTFIILNGGTTNSGKQMGTLQEHLGELGLHGIKTATFHEPDLNDALTAVVFLVDERVWNYEKYPPFNSKFVEFMTEYGKNGGYIDPETVEEYIERLGGETNVWLREFLSQFKLA